MHGAGQGGEGTFHRGDRAAVLGAFKAGSVHRESFREGSEFGDSELHLKGQESGDRKPSKQRKGMRAGRRRYPPCRGQGKGWEPSIEG